MPAITAIKKQIKREDRFSVYLDGKYAFSLSSSELIQSRLHEGDQVSGQQIEDFKRVSTLGKLYDRVMTLLMARPRSEQEIKLYFKKKETPPDIADTILQRLKSEGHIDDESFAQWWVDQRRQFKSRSRRMLQAELAQKGIKRRIADDVLSHVERSDDLEMLKTLIEKKRRLTRYQDREKLIAYLARQGFGYGDVVQALNDLEH